MAEDFYPQESTPTQPLLSALERTEVLRRLTLDLDRLRMEREQLRRERRTLRQERDDALQRVRDLEGQLSFHQRSAQLRAEAAESGRLHADPRPMCIRLGPGPLAITAIAGGSLFAGVLGSSIWWLLHR